VAHGRGGTVIAARQPEHAHHPGGRVAHGAPRVRAIYFRWDWQNWTIGLWIERGQVRGHLLCLSLSLEK